MANLNKILIILSLLLFGGLIIKLFVVLLPFILVLVIAAALFNSGNGLIAKIKNWLIPQKAYVQQYGVVYKECSFCGQKADRNSKKCDNCQKAFE